MNNEDTHDIARIQDGDYQRFGQIVDRYKLKVYAVIYRMVHNRADAEDLTQEAFIHAFKAIDRFDPNRPFAPWLYRIAINLSINFIKKRDRYPTVSTEEVTLHSKATRYNPVRQTEQKLLLEEVEKKISQLPDDLKTILILRVNEEMSYDEIAQTLGISRGTVMSRLSRARAKLKELVFGGRDEGRL